MPVSFFLNSASYTAKVGDRKLFGALVGIDAKAAEEDRGIPNDRLEARAAASCGADRTPPPSLVREHQAGKEARAARAR